MEAGFTQPEAVSLPTLAAFIELQQEQAAEQQRREAEMEQL